MSLNGLDASSVNEAYDSTIAEAAGWLLLKYTTRDEVDIYKTGNEGSSQVREAIDQYEEKSPLYGLLIYRRKKVLLKYVPEGTSRLLQARLAVHMQSVIERFPHDAILPLQSAAGLTDAALSSTVSALKTSNSIKSMNSLKRRRLTEIVEDAGEASVPNTSTITPPESPTSEGLSLHSVERQPEDDKDQDDGASTLTAKAVRDSHANIKANGITTNEPSRTDIPVSGLKSTVVSTLDNDSPHEQPISPVDSLLPTSDRSTPNTFSPSSETFAYLYKPKVKLAPRPIVEPRHSSPYERPVSSLPTGIQLQSREQPRMISPIATQSVPRSPPFPIQTKNSPTNGIIPTSVQSAPSPEIRPVSRGSFMTVPADVKYNDEPALTPEKQRLMKALQKRKQQQKARQLAKENKVEDIVLNDRIDESAGIDLPQKIPSLTSDESKSPTKIDTQVVANHSTDTASYTLRNDRYISPNSPQNSQTLDVSMSETNRPTTMIRIVPESAPESLPPRNDTVERDLYDRVAQQEPNHSNVQSNNLISLPSILQFPDWPDNIKDGHQPTQASLSDEKSVTNLPQVEEPPVEHLQAGESAVDDESKEAIQPLNSMPDAETPHQETEQSVNPSATLSAESIDLLLPMEGQTDSSTPEHTNHTVDNDEAQDDPVSGSFLIEDEDDSSVVHHDIEAESESRRSSAVSREPAHNASKGNDDIVPKAKPAAPINQGTIVNDIGIAEEGLIPQYQGEAIVDSPRELKRSTEFDSDINKHTLEGGYNRNEHNPPEFVASTASNTAAVAPNSDSASRDRHVSRHEIINKTDDLTEDEYEPISPIEPMSMKRGSRPPPINASRNSVAHSKTASLSEEDSLFEELQSATVEEATSVTLAKTPTTPFSPSLPRQGGTRRGSEASHKTTRTPEEDLPPTPALPVAKSNTSSPASQYSQGMLDRVYDGSTTPDAFASLSRSATRDVSSSYAPFAGVISRSRQSSLSPIGPDLERPSSRKSTVSSLISQRIKAFEDKQSATSSPQQAPLSAVRAQIVTLRKVSLNNAPPHGNTPVQPQSGRNTPSPYPSPSPSPHNFAQRWGFAKTSKKETTPRENFTRDEPLNDTISKLNEGVSDSLPRIAVMPEQPPSLAENKTKKSFFSSSKPIKKKTNSMSSSTSFKKEGRLSVETTIGQRDSPTAANSSDTRDRSRSPSSVESLVVDGDKKDAKKKAGLLKRLSGLGSSSRRTIAETISEPAKDEPAKEEPIEPQTGPNWRSSIVLGDLNIQFPDTLLWKRRYVEVDSQGFLVLAPPQSDKASKTALRRYHVSEFRKPYVPEPDREELPYSVNLDFHDGNTIQCACDGSLGQQRAYQALTAARDAFVT